MSECVKNEFDHVFTWNIEQLSSYVLHRSAEINSPLFTADSIGETIWHLTLYPIGYLGSTDKMPCLLHYIRNDSEFESIYCSFMMEIIGSNGKPVISKRNNGLFCKEWSCLGVDFPKKYVFQNLPTCPSNNTLTIRCSMKAINLQTEDTISRNIARTKFCVDKCSFKWRIANDTNRVQCKKFQCPAKSFYEIFLAFLEGNLVIEIKSLKTHVTHQKAVCTIFLLDINDMEKISTTAEHLFQPNSECWHFPLFSEETLKLDPTNCRLNEIFSLKCDFSVSNGSTVQETENLCDSFINLLTVPSEDRLTVLKNDFQGLLENQKFADLKIKTCDETFLVHKAILCARSPVFSAMFENDMIETQTGVIDIQDVETHTLVVFMKFLYTGIIETDEMNSQSAIELLMVADKYQVISLKDYCCYFLMKSLTVKNVCEVLNVADMIGHDLLKKYAINYIESQAGTILPSDEWKRLVEKNLMLSTEIVCQISSNLGNVCRNIRV